jgi:hypothetical protein
MAITGKITHRHAGYAHAGGDDDARLMPLGIGADRANNQAQAEIYDEAADCYWHAIDMDRFFYWHTIFLGS